ncbi:MAG: Omp28-related outer membrane protein [Paludibacteraceae bacterium]|nr:Omp28-related outer membrane protein [Paludibacteraceae bacterium]
MKKYIYILLLGLLCGCEVIPEDERLIPLPQPEVTEGTHVLIEYTGFRCLNCPNAAAMADDLLATYGKQLVVVSMHPASNPFTQGAYDYTCPEADIYYQFMGGTASTPFPTGNIDLIEQDNDYLTDYLQWPAVLAERMSSSCNTSLSSHAELSQDGKAIYVTTEATAIQEQDCQIVVWLTEDNVIGVQAMPDGSANMEYRHMHMLRASGKEVWGKSVYLSATPAVVNDTITLPDGCQVENCHVIALTLTTQNKQIDNATQIEIAQ